MWPWRDQIMSFNNEYRDSLVLIRHFTVPLKVANIDFSFEVESQRTVLSDRFAKKS